MDRLEWWDAAGLHRFRLKDGVSKTVRRDWPGTASWPEGSFLEMTVRVFPGVCVVEAHDPDGRTIRTIDSETAEHWWNQNGNGQPWPAHIFQRVPPLCKAEWAVRDTLERNPDLVFACDVSEEAARLGHAVTQRQVEQSVRFKTHQNECLRAIVARDKPTVRQVAALLGISPSAVVELPAWPQEEYESSVVGNVDDSAFDITNLVDWLAAGCPAPEPQRLTAEQQRMVEKYYPLALKIAATFKRKRNYAGNDEADSTAALELCKAVLKMPTNVRDEKTWLSACVRNALIDMSRRRGYEQDRGLINF